jgi:hypothetical protein
VTDELRDVLFGAPSRPPEDHPMFRWAQLLLLVSASDLVHSDGTAMERLVHYDFFSSNPYLVVDQSDPARGDLALAGFHSEPLSYASSGQRFATRRERIEFDLAALVARGLVAVAVVGGRVMYRSTEAGRHVRGAFTAMYADDYSRSASLIVCRLSKLSDSALAERARDWLQAPSALADVQLKGQSSE